MEDEENPFAGPAGKNNRDKQRDAVPVQRLEDHEEENPFDHRPTDNDLQRREQDLLRREAELATREKALQEGRPLPGSNFVLKHANNWPFKCLPLAYHDISTEIPAPQRAIVRQFYMLMFLDWLGLFWNFLTTFVLYVRKESTAQSGTSCLFSVIYMGFGIPLSWVLWYRSIYEGVRDSSSRKWMCFFCNFFCHIAWSILMIVGVPYFNMVGVLWAIQLLGDNTNSLFAIVNIALWSIMTVMAIGLVKRAHSAWARGGGREKLQGQAAAAAVQTAKQNPDLMAQAVQAAV